MMVVPMAVQTDDLTAAHWAVPMVHLRADLMAYPTADLKVDLMAGSMEPHLV
jgi:hypothetical protein